MFLSGNYILCYLWESSPLKPINSYLKPSDIIFVESLSCTFWKALSPWTSILLVAILTQLNASLCVATHAVISIIRLILFPHTASFPGVVCWLPSCGIRGWDTLDVRHKERDRGSQAFTDGALRGPGVTVIHRVPRNTMWDIASYCAPPRLKATHVSQNNLLKCRPRTLF